MNQTIKSVLIGCAIAALSGIWKDISVGLDGLRQSPPIPWDSKKHAQAWGMAIVTAIGGILAGLNL